ncbi:MAG TPA: hypothetical protein VMS74_14615 [Acidimicrobiia bacterium]|nr:hypothetical protein [Acidimicrobiia bacterium]
MPVDAPIVAVDVPLVGDHRRKHWAKVVYGVDETKSSGWAFVGDFINDGGIQDVPAGSVLLAYGETGSRTNPNPEARVYTVNPDSTLSLEEEASGRAWARTIRDTVERLLHTDRPAYLEWQTDLMTFSDEALAEELRRRGWTIERPEEAT